MNEGNFDFQQVSEENEQLDFDKLIPCPHCKKPIPHDATICFYCAETVARAKKSGWIIWIVAFILIVFILSLIF